VSRSRGAVNSLAPHPYHAPLFAASGLDDDAKLFRCSDACTYSATAAHAVAEANNRNREIEQSSMPIFRGMLARTFQGDDSSDDEDATGGPRERCGLQ
jgi:hypothetical protein